MKKSVRIIAIILVMLMVLSVVLVAVSARVFAATGAVITYEFKSDIPGDAEGVITLTPAELNSGTCYLYWADDYKALVGFDPLGSFDLAKGEAKLNMPAHTVIPPDAKKLIAFVYHTEPWIDTEDWKVADADAVYSIPDSKQLDFASEDALYSFGAISDPQLANDSYGSNSYPYDEEHLKSAFQTLGTRNVDFTVVSGDIVNDQNGNKTYAAEYRAYQKILADSFYSKPVYEALGNHDVGTVWNKNGGYYNDNEPFIMGTGLDSKAETINAGKPYFEITEPTTGDHFIFMALEGGFYTDRGTQFSKAQLDWLEGLLKKYSTDGKNIFIIEHANVQGWGSGDKLTTPYYYDLGLNPQSADVARFISLMEQYKECVIITGHTHLELSAQYNYSDNNGTSAVMMHNSAVGGVRRLVNGTVDRTAVKDLSEGYIVDVYEDCIIFSGINLCYDDIMPLCSYMIPFDTEAVEKPTEPSTATEPTSTETQPATTVTEPTSTESQPATTASVPASSTAATEPVEYLYGDADTDSKVTVKDATLIQKHTAELLSIEGTGLVQAEVTGDGTVNVKDATAIQKHVADLIDSFPVEEAQEKKDIAQTGAISPTFELLRKYRDTYYMYSSFDQYQALKDYGNDPTDAEITERERNLEAIITAIGKPLLDLDKPQSSIITVYFSNNKNWSEVCAYVWKENASGSSDKLAAWPGTKMTYVDTNELGEKIYSLTFDYSLYDNIIFNNNDAGSQTEDIHLSGENNVGYYISGGSGNSYTCETYMR